MSRDEGWGRVHADRVTWPERGIYQLVHFPATEHEELFTAWFCPSELG